MKRLFILLFILVNLSALGQTYTAERIVATRGFYLKDRWVDSIGVDTSMSGEIRSLPSSDAVYRLVHGRLANLSIPYTAITGKPDLVLQATLDDSTSVLRDSINALRADIGSGGGGASYTPTITTASTSQTLSTDYETWVFTGSSAATFTLPASGTRYVIKSRGSGTLTVSGTIYTNSAKTSITILNGDSYTFQWDGSYWIVY